MFWLAAPGDGRTPGDFNIDGQGFGLASFGMTKRTGIALIAPGLIGLLVLASGSAEGFQTNGVVADPRVREYVMPARVLWQSPAEECLVEGAEQLLRPYSGQVTLENKAACVLRHQGKAPGI